MQQPTLKTVWKLKTVKFHEYKPRTQQLSKTKPKTQAKKHKRHHNQPLVILVLTSLDVGHGGEGGGGGTTPGGGFGPPPLF